MKLDGAYKPTLIYQALRLVSLGLPLTKVARKFDVPYHTLRTWVKRYAGLRADQIEAKAKGIRPGRKK